MTDEEEILRLIIQIEEYRSALALIASPMRLDGTWNRDRKACQQLAEKTLSVVMLSPPPASMLSDIDDSMYRVVLAERNLAWAENDRLRERITEYEDSYRAVIAEKCFAGDEIHCSCVPPLRREIHHLTEKLKTLVTNTGANSE